MAAARPNGMVFVSYAHKDRERVEPLILELQSRFNVFWDPHIRPGDRWFATIAQQLRSARCVLVLWTKNSIDSRFLKAEMLVAVAHGTLLPVRLSADARVPRAYDQFHHLELSGWPGTGADGLARLLTTLKAMLKRPLLPHYERGLVDRPGLVPHTVGSATELKRLASDVGGLAGVLVEADGPAAGLILSLGEVHKTYVAVSEAIDTFLVPTTAPVKSRLRLFAELETGRLVQLIDSKRGHCSRILEHYGRAGGIRDWLLPRFNKEVLRATDEVFGKLSTADGDLFAVLGRIGNALTTESTVLTNLLVSGQHERAARRIAQCRELLSPLRLELISAISDLQQIQASLGYVPAKPKNRSRPILAGR